MASAIMVSNLASFVGFWARELAVHRVVCCRSLPTADLRGAGLPWRCGGTVWCGFACVGRGPDGWCGVRRFVAIGLAVLAFVGVAGAGEDAAFEVMPSYVRVSNVRLADADAGAGWRLVSFDVGWDESWRGPDRPSWVEASDNWDAVWVFVKFRIDGGAWRHATLASGGHIVPDGAALSAPTDAMGGFVHRSSSGYGTFTANGVGLAWDCLADGVPAGASAEVQPFAIEMVYVPEGPSYLGSGGSSQGEFRAGGTSNSPYLVATSAPIDLGDAAGQLTWDADANSGSPSGATAAGFATGYAAFYVMKYEVTQAEYVNFLNTLSQAQADARRPTVAASRFAITGQDVGSFVTSLPYVAAHWMNWADGVAFADWAGLRPMTELEFEKAARGPLAPVADEYAWGSTSVTRTRGFANSGTITETPIPEDANVVNGFNFEGPARVGSMAVAGRSRRDAGAGYYGALELSGNVAEALVTVGNAEGRAFEAAHGDGVLDALGNANAASWPGSSATGVGYRGGNWSWGMIGLLASYRGSAAIVEAGRHSVIGFRGARSAP